MIRSSWQGWLPENRRHGVYTLQYYNITTCVVYYTTTPHKNNIKRVVFWLFHSSSSWFRCAQTTSAAAKRSTSLARGLQFSASFTHRFAFVSKLKLTCKHLLPMSMLHSRGGNFGTVDWPQMVFFFFIPLCMPWW